MKTFALRLLAVIATASLVIAAGCVAAPTPAPTAVPPAEPTAVPTAVPPTEPPPAAEPVKIGVYTVAWSTPSMDMMAKLIEMFNEEHKGKIEAEYIQGDWDGGDTYIASGVAGGGGIADVIEWWSGGVQEWYAQDFVIDLSPYITPEIRATMPEELWAARTAEDGAVFMNGTVTGEHLLLYYNPALLEAAGIALPADGEAWTWDEFLVNAKKLTVDANGKRLGEDGFDANNVVQWGYVPRLDNEKLWEEGGSFAMQASKNPLVRRGDDGTWDIFFDEAAMPALRTYLSVIEEGVTPALAVGLTGESQDELFAQGQAAMVLRGYFNIGVLYDRYPDFKFAVMPTPMEPGTKYYSSNSGQGFGVPVVSKHPAEAAEFLFWFQQATPQAMWASSLFMAPCNPAALEDPVLKDDPIWDAMRFYKSVEEIVTVDHNNNEEEFRTTLFAPNLMAVVQGEKSLDDAIAEIKAASKDILNQGY